MIIGSAGLTVIYGLMSAAYAYGMLGLPVLMLVLIAISIYALTLAPVTWVLLSEMFPNKVRGTAMSVSTLALWVACFALTYTFPLLNAGLGASGSFLLTVLFVPVVLCSFTNAFQKRKGALWKNWKKSLLLVKLR